MDKATALQRIGSQWMGFIMRGDTPEETLDTIEAVIAGGSLMVEVAFTTPNVCKVVAEIRRRYGDDIVLAAGTVRTPDQARMAVENGAHAVVSPDLHAPVVEAALKLGVVSVPGCMTPTEVSTALRLGADIIKVFPCDVGGPNFLRYIRGPFPEARMLPAGAVTLANMRDYHAAGAFAAVAGVTTEMKLLQAVKAHRYDEVTRSTREWLAAVREMRST
jgi:2-dehydro-3-deoxyphosphogluconate aldolase/(4S)-4-hydroxy-2-oxoglutarate aldolase